MSDRPRSLDVEALDVEAHVREIRAPSSANLMPAFPRSVLPKPLRDLCDSAAESMSVPFDMPAVFALAAAATAIGRSRVLKVKKDWLEPPRFWFAIVCDPGTAKTPLFRAMIDPILEIERGYAEQNTESRRQHERDLQVHSVKLDRWKKECRKSDCSDDPPPPPERPAYRRIRIDDATLEAVVSRLVDNARGLGLLTDEISTWVGSFDKYRGGADRQAWLSISSGSPVTVDRRSNAEPLYVPEPFVVVAGTIQPDALRDFVAQDRRHDGFLERFLFAWPDPCEIRYSEKGISETAKKDWGAIIRKLAELELDADGRPVVLELTTEAREVWRELSTTHLARLNGGIPERKRALWRKLHGVAARLALLIHLLRQASGEPLGDRVDARSVKAGFELIEYFAAHWTRCVSHLQGKDVVALAQRILHGIQPAHDGLDKSEIHALVGRNLPTEEIDEALELLRTRRLAEVRKEPTRGRPREVWYPLFSYEESPSEGGDSDV